jgi:site-specific DNA-adenine methylase
MVIIEVVSERFIYLFFLNAININMADKKKNKKQRHFFNPIPYVGAKSRELKHIFDNMPKNVSTVIDVFGGGGSVAIGIKREYPKLDVIYNDKLKYLKVMFDSIADGSIYDIVDDVYDQLQLMDHKKEFTMAEINDKSAIYDSHYKKLIDDTGTLSDFAFNVIAVSPRICGHIGYSSRKKNNRYTLTAQSHETTIAKMKYCRETIRQLKTHSEDFKYFIEKYKDDDKVFIYMDPPYLNRSNNKRQYMKEFMMADIEYIISCIKDPGYKCRLMLHIDFSGFSFVELGDHLRHLYPTKYNVGAHNNGKRYYQTYHAMFCNYKKK